MLKKQKRQLKKENKKKTKTKKTINLNLSKTELLHLRDLMSILLPSETLTTVSKNLASFENRAIQENQLFEKIFDLCQENDLPIGNNAPDYFVNWNIIPNMEVSLLNLPNEINEEDYCDNENEEEDENYQENEDI